MFSQTHSLGKNLGQPLILVAVIPLRSALLRTAFYRAAPLRLAPLRLARLKSHAKDAVGVIDRASIPAIANAFFINVNSFYTFIAT